MKTLQILADTEAYHTLEDNLKKMGFERAENEQKQKLSWRWQTRTEHGALMVLELLADAPEIAGGKVQPLPADGTISALNIPHSSIVFDLYQVTEIQAELLGDNGVTTEKVKHANLVSFICLKLLAFDQRFERNHQAGWNLFGAAIGPLNLNLRSNGKKQSNIDVIY